MVNTLKNQVISGAFWQFFERIGVQTIGMVMSIILARLLCPEDFGTVALLTIFIGVSWAFVDSGFGSALVQKKDATELDYNSVFYANIALAVSAYLVLCLCAPMIASFYRRPLLVPVLRVTALSLVFNAASIVQNAVLSRNLLFKRSFKIGCAHTFSTGVVGIVLALMGYGVWALVWGSLTGAFVDMTLRFFLVGWRPRLLFSFRPLRTLFSFGCNIFFAGIINSFFTNLYGLVIGRVYTAADLSFYNRGNQLPQSFMNSVDQAISGVSFPALSRIQDDKAKVRATMRNMITCSCYLIMPMMILLAFCAEPIILVLLGEKWAPAIPFMQIACFAYTLYPFHTVNLQAIKAIGKSRVFLQLEVVKKLISLGVLIFCYKHGVVLLAAVSAFLGAPLGVVINAWPNSRLLGYSLKMQVRDVSPVLALCTVPVLVLMAIRLSDFGDLPTIVLSAILSLTAYFGTGLALKIGPAMFYSDVLVRFVRKQHPEFGAFLERLRG